MGVGLEAERRRLRVGLVFGGRSGEHAVSVVSARFAAAALAAAGHEVVPMAIDRQGLWADAETAQAILERSGDQTEAVVELAGSVRLDPRLCDGGLDVVFPILHGPYGEDGAIQGLLEMLDLAYVGCDVTASALCMDKALSKRLLVEAGLRTPPWVELGRREWDRDRSAATARCLELGLPLFVKPVRLGSSVGISRVAEPAALGTALATAFEHDQRAIVELGLEAREIEVAVLGGEPARASRPGEVVPGHDFYDYADKYVDDACELLAPAPLEPAEEEAARELAVRVFALLGCAGMARVDLFLERASGELWVNEVNTIPGFTSISMYPRLWRLSGVDGPALVDELLALALDRHRRRAALRVR